MYICYIDESGHCGRKLDPKQPVEVLCGVITDITKLYKTQRELAFIVRFLKKNGIALTELKASDAYAGRKNWSGVSPRNRDRIFDLILGWSKARVCKFVVCPIDSGKFFNLKKNGCEISKRLKNPYEAGALNIMLAVQKYQRNKKSNKGKTILVFDEQKGHDGNIIEILSDDLAFTDGYTGFIPKPKVKHPPERFDQIVDIPHFSKSHLSVLIQIADLTAFIVNAYLCLLVYNVPEKYEGEINKISAWYDFIGQNRINHTAIDPPGNDLLCDYYKSLRPPGWSAKAWTC